MSLLHVTSIITLLALIGLTGCASAPMGRQCGPGFDTLGQGCEAAPLLSTNHMHTCATRDGALYCWGLNEHGQLGPAAGAVASTPTPQLVFASGVTALSAGEHHTCAVHDGALKCWGSNQRGQLGVETNLGEQKPNPAPQTVFDAEVTAVAAGAEHTCAIRDGALYCWGHNKYGQLGTGDTADTHEPERVLRSGVTAVATYGAHTCAVHRGALKCWGSNRSGQLGEGEAAGDEGPVTSPAEVFETGVTALAVGGSFTCAAHDGALKCWGNNQFGSLGTPGVPGGPAARRVFDGPVSALSAGLGHACGGSGGALQCWGFNFGSQVGPAASMAERDASPPRQRFDAGVSAVAAGSDHSCAIHQGRIMCWGLNKRGQVGAPAEAKMLLEPTRVMLPGEEDVASP